MGGSQSSENAGKTKLNSKTKQWLESEIRTHQIVVFVKPNCPFCARVKKLFGDLSAPIHIIDLTKREDMKQIQDCLQEATGTRTVPKVFIAGQSIGGCDETLKMHDLGKMKPRLVELHVINP